MANPKCAMKYIRFPKSASRRGRRSRHPSSRQLDMFFEDKTIKLPLGKSPLNTAVLYDECGDWEAIEWYRRAIACDDRPVEALCALGEFYARNFKWKKALACFEDAVAREPFCFEVHLCLGDYLANTGNDIGALDHYQWCLRISPKSVSVRVAMSFVLARLNRKEEAIVELEACRGLTRKYKDKAEDLLRELRGMVSHSDLV